MSREAAGAGPRNGASPSPQGKKPGPRAQGQDPDLGQGGGEDGPETSPRRPSSDRPNAFHVADWLLEGISGLSEELLHNDLGLPEEFWVHAYAARREGLLAARALIDHLLERTPASEAAPAPKSRRGHVDISFD